VLDRADIDPYTASHTDYGAAGETPVAHAQRLTVTTADRILGGFDAVRRTLTERLLGTTIPQSEARR